MKRAAAILVLVGLLASGAIRAQSLRVQGPSVGRILVNAALADFQGSIKTPLKVVYGVNGTGAALDGFCRGRIDAVLATRPILAREIEACRAAGTAFVEVPVALDAVVVVVNPRNTFVTNLSLGTLRTLWSAESEGKLTRWNQIDAKWPASTFKLFGEVAESEGASYFGEAVLGAGVARRDYTASVDEPLLVQAVARDPDALGYVSLAAYIENRGRLKAVRIVESAGGPTEPSAETVAQGRYRTLSRPLLLYVRTNALEEPAAREFQEYWLANGASIASRAKLVALTPLTYTAGAGRMRGRVPGSSWEGRIAVGATSQDIERKLTVK